jgi:chemotaxis signal transduction protein
MDVLLTTIDGRRFALDCAETVEVLPLVSHRPVGAGPAWLLGLIDVRGELMPLVDLSAIIAGHPTEPRRACRIVVLRIEGQLFEQLSRKVGVLVPELDGPAARDFTGPSAHPGFTFAGASHLGPTIVDEAGMVQLIRCTRILEGDGVLRQLPGPAGDGGTP